MHTSRSPWLVYWWLASNFRYTLCHLTPLFDRQSAIVSIETKFLSTSFIFKQKYWDSATPLSITLSTIVQAATVNFRWLYFLQTYVNASVALVLRARTRRWVNKNQRGSPGYISGSAIYPKGHFSLFSLLGDNVAQTLKGKIQRAEAGVR